MDERALATALEKVVNTPGLVVQVICQAEHLHIYVNCPPAQTLEQGTIVQQARTTLNELVPEGRLQLLTIYCRELGAVDPEWQQTIPLNVSSDLEAKAPASEKKLEPRPPAAPSKFVQKARNSAFTASSFIPGSDAKTSAQKALEALDALSSGQSAAAETEFNSTSPFAGYCFITNRRLLRSQIVPPPRDIVLLIQFFHELSPNEKRRILDIIENFFKQDAKISGLHESEDINVWIEQLQALTPESTRKAAIWLSRYCAFPEDTMAELDAVSYEEPSLSSAESSAQRTKNLTAARYSPATESESAEPEKGDTSQELPPKSTSWPLWILPIGALGGVLALLFLGLRPGKQAEQSSFDICLGRPAAVQTSCALAATWLGEDLLAQARQNSQAPTPSLMADFFAACDQALNISSDPKKPGSSDKITRSDEEILPGVLMVTTSQSKPGSKEKTVQACVMRAIDNNVEVLVAQDVPADWH
ncbi:MAG: hypothetical protein AAGG02_19920, partial [Cyanobacteria bacterium P01_H01_bin.15]